MEFPKCFAAAKRIEKDEWALGDALLAEVGPPRSSTAQQERFARCAAELAEAGMRYPVERLIRLRNLAHSFHRDDRPTSVEVAREAGTPAVLRKAEELSDGGPISTRHVRQVRKAVVSHARTAEGRSMPTRQARERSATAPRSELRHHADVLAISGHADRAARLGRQFVEALAGRDLSAAERRELEADVELVIETWKACRSAVANPLAKSAEQFLGRLS